MHCGEYAAVADPPATERHTTGEWCSRPHRSFTGRKTVWLIWLKAKPLTLRMSWSVDDTIGKRIADGQVTFEGRMPWPADQQNTEACFVTVSCATGIRRWSNADHASATQAPVGFTTKTRQQLGTITQTW